MNVRRVHVQSADADVRGVAARLRQFRRVEVRVLHRRASLEELLRLRLVEPALLRRHRVVVADDELRVLLVVVARVGDRLAGLGRAARLPDLLRRPAGWCLSTASVVSSVLSRAEAQLLLRRAAGCRLFRRQHVVLQQLDVMLELVLHVLVLLDPAATALAATLLGVAEVQVLELGTLLREQRVDLSLPLAGSVELGLLGSERTRRWRRQPTSGMVSIIAANTVASPRPHL